jgi:hypothetical protein
MQDFRDRKIPVLVASDLAARGLDVEALDFVVNNDLPEDPPTYVHRVGRTARAGRSGKALSLVGFGDAFRLEKLEGFLGKPIERQTFDIDKLTGPLPRFGNVPAVAASAPVGMAADAVPRANVAMNAPCLPPPEVRATSCFRPPAPVRKALRLPCRLPGRPAPARLRPRVRPRALRLRSGLASRAG